MVNFQRIEPKLGRIFIRIPRQYDLAVRLYRSAQRQSLKRFVFKNSAWSSIIKVLFIVLSLAAALLLPINIIIEVKSLPTHRDSATLHSGVTDCHYLLIIPFIRVSIINFDQGTGISKQNKTR